MKIVIEYIEKDLFVEDFSKLKGVKIKELEDSSESSFLGNNFVLISRWFDIDDFYKFHHSKIEFNKKMIKQHAEDTLNSEAKAHGYDNIISACSYASSKGSFGKESQSFVDWRDAVWTYLGKIKKDTEEGLVELTVDEIINNLPKRVL